MFSLTFKAPVLVVSVAVIGMLSSSSCLGEEVLLSDVIKSMRVAQNAITDHRVAVNTPEILTPKLGLYKSKKRGELHLDAASPTEVKFKLVVNGLPGKVACEEGVVDCLEREGKAIKANRSYLYKSPDFESENAKVKISPG